MAYTAVTIEDTVRYPDGMAIPYAVVVAWPKQGFSNAGTQTNAVSDIADANGEFDLVLNATDDAGSAPMDPGLPAGETLAYHVLAFDPKTGEHVFDADVTVPHATTPTTLAALPVI